MKSFQLLVLISSMFLVQWAEAQEDSAQEHKTVAKLSLNYNSSLNYFGRTDSLKSTGFFPMLEISFGNDLYINAAPVFVNNTARAFSYAGTITSIGYLHSTNKWITNVYLLKPFYRQTSSLIQSALKAQAGLSLSRLNRIINLTLGGDVKYSDRLDYGATAGIDHIVRKQFENKGVLVIDPSFYTYAGTQNFTTTYYKKNTSFLLLPTGTEEVTENVQHFNVLAYEFSAPLVYAKGKWMFLMTPSYIIPQHLITVPGRPDLSEQGSNMFYATGAVKFTF